MLATEPASGRYQAIELVVIYYIVIYYIVFTNIHLWLVNFLPSDIPTFVSLIPLYKMK